MSKAIKCERCNKRYRNQPEWNATFKAGRITGYLCPKCQTPEEYLEAAVNEATVDYSATEEIPGVTEEQLVAMLDHPEQYDVAGWANHINRGLVKAHNTGMDIADPNVLVEQITLIGNASAHQFIKN